MAHLQKLSIPFASYKHDSHSHGRAEFKGQRTSQSLWFFLCSYSTQELSRKRPFFCNLLLKTLFAADAAGRAWGCPRLSDNTSDRKRQWGILTDKIPREIYILVYFVGAIQSC